MIWFDNTRVYGTPSYYVQMLFAQHRPDVLLPVDVDGPQVNLPRLPPEAVATYGATPLKPYAPESIPSLYASGGLSQKDNEAVLFLVNPFAEPRAMRLTLKGARPGEQASVAQLTVPNPEAGNSFEAPEAVVPRTFTVAMPGAATLLSSQS